MKNKLLAAAAVVVALGFGAQARADVIPFSLSGDGVSASGSLTITPDTTPGDPAGAYTITAISGTFSDSSSTIIGGAISNATITGLVALDPYTNDLAASLSQVDTISNQNNLLGADDQNTTGNTSLYHLTYDNLLYPGGSPDVCGDGYYGGLFDVFGALITLDNGDVVNLWSGSTDPTETNIYGIAVITPTGTVDDQTTYNVIDDVGSGLTMTAPEPASLWLFVTALLGGLVLTRRSSGTGRVAPALG